ncbi:ankyrin repeat domain-containing protein [Marinobacter sp.]|uniref:ankyrin repeat domain-containing protein n=1 Tax=Marinobacter sp. TaxID=50741 RepID=UPI003565B085
MNKAISPLAATLVAFLVSGCATQQSLSDAASNNDIDAVVKMVEAGMDPLEPNESGQTAFSIVYDHAFETTKTDRAAEAALPNFARDIVRKSERWASDLCTKVRNRSITVEEFEERVQEPWEGVTLRVRGSYMSMDNHVPLEHCLVVSNRTEYLDVLFQHGGDPNAIGKKDRRALDVAVFYGLTNVTEMLLNRGADPNLTIDDESNVLEFLVGNSQFGNRVNDKALLQMIIAAGMDVNARIKDLTPIEHAILNNNLVAAQMLIDAGADLSRPLHVAGYYGKEYATELLLQANAPTGPHPDFNDGTALHTAISGLADGQHRNVDLVLTIASASAHSELNKPDDGGYTVLSMAKRVGDQKLVEGLKAAGASLEEQVVSASGRQAEGS